MPRTDRTPSGAPAPVAPSAAVLPVHRPSRRDFLRALGTASALPLAAAAATGWAQPPSTPPAGPAPGTAPPPTAPEPAPDPEKAADAADAKSLLEIVERRFGSRLDAAQLDSVRGDLEDNMRAARALRGLQLTNADEPDVVFRAVMREEP